MQIGKFTIRPASDGPFLIDGGSLFGIVPKALWSKQIPADDRNCIALATTSMLVQTPTQNVLVECGTGRKMNAKLRSIYGLSDEIQLVKSLAALRVAPEDISAVIVTHLHMDHAGCCTKLIDDRYAEERDKVEYSVPTFPNARYFVQREEWSAAIKPNPATKGSYLPENYLPLERAGQLELIDGDGEILPGIRVRVTGGHTNSHQLVIVESQGEGIVFPGDIAALTLNLRPAWNTAFDHHPVETMLAKQRLFDEIIEKNWLAWFYHEPRATAVSLKRGDGQPEVDRIILPHKAF